MALSFGVTSTGGYGVLQSVSQNETVEIAEARGADGKITDQIAYSKTYEATAEGIFNGDTLSGAGAVITVGSLTGLVTSQSVSETNTGYKTVSVTIQKKDSATQAEYE